MESKRKRIGSMSLKEWIDNEGLSVVAKLMRVNESTVGHWRRGYVLPKAEQMLKIKKLSRGVVTFDSMIEAHFSTKNKSNRWSSKG